MDMMTELNEHFYQLLEQVAVAEQAVKRFVEREGNRGREESNSFAYVEERLQAIVVMVEFIKELVKKGGANESASRAGQGRQENNKRMSNK
jgi:hypothetical protein